MIEKKVIKQTTLGVFTLCFLLSATSWARPPKVTVDNVSGDVTVSLPLEEEFIKDDSRVPCQVSVEVTGERKPFTEGDTIKIAVIEDDTPFIGFLDDALWGVEETVDAEIASAQRFERTYDCTFESVEDFLGGIEVYARVEVNKDECNTIAIPPCFQDSVNTSNISMGEKVDDESEEDDTSAEAFLLPRRGVSDRVARDADWLRVTYEFPVEFMARLESDFNGGDLNLTLYKADLSVVGEASLEESGEAKRLDLPTALLPGDYLLEISLADPDDFNFYDLVITEGQITTECAPGSEDTRPCARCGVEIKTCSSEGEWGDWSMCDRMGVCDPGSEENQGCGDGGTQSRTCNMECQWDAFSSCVQCEDGQTESCYGGPQSLAGVGSCVEGTRTCSRGQWSSCQGDVQPNGEFCQDGIDNDCDGLTDSGDPDCVASLGEQCVPGECGMPFQCLTTAFAEGYCGGTDCTQCGLGSVCGQVLGQEYCLKPCAGVVDCRFGYICAPAGTMGEQVCVPACESDEACGVGFICNAEQVCEAQGGVSVGMKQAEEGCQQGSHRSVSWILGLMSLLFVMRRRMQRA